MRLDGAKRALVLAMAVILALCALPYGALAATNDPYRTIKYGNSGEDIKNIQRALRTLGYFDGDIGGNYLDKTQAAVKAFQRAKGYTVTDDCSITDQYLIIWAATDDSDYTQGDSSITIDALSLGKAEWKTSGKGMKIRIEVANESRQQGVKAFEIRYYPVDVWGDSMLDPGYSYYYTTTKTIKSLHYAWSDYMGLDERSGVSRIHAYVSRICYADGTIEIPTKNEWYWDITWK